MMEKRQKIGDRKGKEYRDLNRQIKTNCKEAKERWINNKCAKIETQYGNNHKVHQRINDLTNRKSCSSNSGCIKAKDGTMFFLKEGHHE